MYTYEVSKSEKKILRKAIDTGLQNDYVAAIKDLDAIISKWKEKQLDNHEAYGSLYKAMHDHDKLIARRYDGLSGSHYLNLVGVLYAEDSVTDADLEGLREETMQRIRIFKEL